MSTTSTPSFFGVQKQTIDGETTLVATHYTMDQVDIDLPCREYYEEREKWEKLEIKSIIVPLYPKIYLEAARARHNVWNYLKGTEIGIKSPETQIVKIFLASSRSYKEYLALNNALKIELKDLFLGISVPKFIWVAEISSIASFEKGLCDGIILQDATEPISVDFTMDKDLSLSGHLSLIAGYLPGMYFEQIFGQIKKINIFAADFPAFCNNLR